MTAGQFRLPKAVEADPLAPGLLDRLAAGAGLLWSGASLRVPTLVADDEVKAALLAASRAGFLVRGLEAAERRLAAQERGFELAAGARSGSSVRISRLLVVTNDGAERFYRSVEALLRRYGVRLYALRLELDERELGEMLYGPGQVARLVLVDHKTAVAAVLLAVAGR